jgi:energy-coupling factor transporter transmembrane protein EcfT
LRVLVLFSFSHPAARLLFWLLLAVFLQLASLPLLLLAGLGLMLTGQESRQRWRRLFGRARFLLATLFLVFSYGMPGIHPWGLTWLPSYEGMEEAMLHVLRLMVFLGSLAWLLASLSHQALVGGLWFLLRPFQYLGFPMDRSVVRLSLVLACMENTPAQQWRSWKEWLTPPPVTDELTPVTLSLPPWRKRDGLFLLLLGLLMGVALWCA